VLGEIRTYTAQQGNLDDLVRVLNGGGLPQPSAVRYPGNSPSSLSRASG